MSYSTRGKGHRAEMGPFICYFAVMYCNQTTSFVVEGVLHGKAFVAAITRCREVWRSKAIAELQVIVEFLFRENGFVKE